MSGFFFACFCTRNKKLKAVRSFKCRRQEKIKAVRSFKLRTAFIFLYLSSK